MLFQTVHQPLDPIPCSVRLRVEAHKAPRAGSCPAAGAAYRRWSVIAALSERAPAGCRTSQPLMTEWLSRRAWK